MLGEHRVASDWEEIVTIRKQHNLHCAFVVGFGSVNADACHDVGGRLPSFLKGHFFLMLGSLGSTQFRRIAIV